MALAELGNDVEGGAFDGALGVVYSDDLVAVAKLLLAHRKKFRGTPLKVKGGFLERKPIQAREVTDLSNLPDRHQLLGMVAGTIAAPLTGFVNVQAAVIRKLLYGLEALKDKREKAEAA